MATDRANAFVGEFRAIDAVIDNGNAVMAPPYGIASVDLAGSGAPARSAP